MPIVGMRLGKYLAIADGRPVDECVHQVHGNLRDICVGAGLTEDVVYVELIGGSDEHGLDRNVEPIRVTVTVAWTRKNVIESQAILDYIESSILAILGIHDSKFEVVSDIQVVLIIGGQHTGHVYNRKTMTRTGAWIDPPIERAIAGKDPFGFD